jgi:hypothetical protein
MANNNLPVDGTSWSVAEFANGVVGQYHDTPWIFQSSNTVSAQGHWSGTWQPLGEDRIRVTIKQLQDECEVVFVTSDWFVATKADNLYRLGHKR